MDRKLVVYGLLLIVVSVSGTFRFTKNGFYNKDFKGTKSSKCDSHNVPLPNLYSNKTFGLIIGGSFTGKNKDLLENFKQVLDQTLDSLHDIESAWFKNYAVVIAYDNQHKNGLTSDVIVSNDGRRNFEEAVSKQLEEHYESNSTERSIARALFKLANSVDVEEGSIIYILTDSAASDYTMLHFFYRFTEKQFKIHLIVLGDDQFPGNKDSYDDRKVAGLLELVKVTGGSFYQVKDANNLASFWSTQLTSQYNSATYNLDSSSDCSLLSSELAIDSINTDIVIDVFSPRKYQIFASDPTGQEQELAPIQVTETNELYRLNATDNPGIWYVYLSNNGGLCSVAIRAANAEPFIVGYTNDLENDGDSVPTAEKPTSIVVYSKSYSLSHVVVYNQRDEDDVFFSFLYERKNEYIWNYVTEKPVVFKENIPYIVAVHSYNYKNREQIRQLFAVNAITDN